VLIGRLGTPLHAHPNDLSSFRTSSLAHYP
jgi:hypothetical protein